MRLAAATDAVRAAAAARRHIRPLGRRRAGKAAGLGCYCNENSRAVVGVGR